MAETTVDALVDGGKASAGPPLAPALAPLGVNIGKVVEAINESTKQYNGMQVPVKVIVDTGTKEFRIEVGSPPTSALVKKELGLEKGSGKPNTEKVADMPVALAIKIAQMKQENMLAYELKAATKEVLGTCVSLGVTIDEKEPREVQKEIDEGKYDDLLSGKVELIVDKAAMDAKKAELQKELAEKHAEEDAAKAAEEEKKPAEEEKEGEEKEGDKSEEGKKEGAKKGEKPGEKKEEPKKK